MTILEYEFESADGGVSDECEPATTAFRERENGKYFLLLKPGLVPTDTTPQVDPLIETKQDSPPMAPYNVGMSPFDTHTVIKQLVEAGMPEPQAEIIVFTQARLIDERLATKQDIEGIHKDIEALGAETKKDIEGIHKDIEALRAETKKDIALLRTDLQKDMKLLESSLTVRMGGMLVAAVSVLAALQTFG